MPRPARDPAPRRRGMSLALTAVLAPVLIGFVALAVDTAIVATGRAQLKTVADAAALAGAQQLADDNRLTGSTNLATEIANAQALAQSTGQANSVLGQAAVLQANPGNSATGDIVVGYVDPVAHTWTAPPLANPLLTNSVRVNAYRDASHTGLIPAYFSRMLGLSGSTVAVQSTATVQNYSIAGFRNVNNLSANLLPIVMHNVTYAQMIQAGLTGNVPPIATDNYAYNPTTKTVSPGSDGVYESVLYPVSDANGNWGTVKIGVNDNSTSTLSAQILYGITPAQLATFPGGVIQLDTSQTPPSLWLGANPGISAELKSPLSSIIGNAVTIPIYDIDNGRSGNNLQYRIIAFAGVRILDVNFQGNPKYVIVQPALVRDATAIPVPISTPSTGPAWTSGGLIRLNLTE